MFRGDAFGGQVAMVVQPARLRTRIVDAIFGVACTAHKPLQVCAQTVVKCRLIIDVSDCLCRHLVLPFLTSEGAVCLLKIFGAVVWHVSRLDLDVDPLFCLTLFAIELQSDLSVFQRPDLSQDRLAVRAEHVLVLLHDDPFVESVLCLTRAAGGPMAAPAAESVAYAGTVELIGATLCRVELITSKVRTEGVPSKVFERSFNTSGYPALL